MANQNFKHMQIDVRIGEAYDVIVCGGGTAGCAAAIAAARCGAKTLMIERSFTCGGMLTEGNAGITKFTEHYSDKLEYRRNVLEKLGQSPKDVQVVGGITKEYVDRMIANGGAVSTDGQAGSYVFTDRYEAQFTMIEMLSEAGVDVLYGTNVCNAVMDGNKIVGVVVYNKDGFTQYTAARVVDATGDGDVAAMAGATFKVGADENDLKEGGGDILGRRTGCGIMYRVRGVDASRLLAYLEQNPDKFIQHNFGVMMMDDVIERAKEGKMYVFRFMVTAPDGEEVPVQFYNAPADDEAILLGLNTGIQANGLDTMDTSVAQAKLFLGIRDGFEHIKKTVPGFENARFCYIPDIGVRETRRIEGDYVVTGRDLLYGVEFEDSIGCGGHPVDMSGMDEEIEKMKYEHWRFHIPYRILLPKGLENLTVAGRCVSATRLAWGCLRPTAQCMVMGEAAGTAAALSAKYGVTCRELEYTRLREVLLENGAVL